MNLQWSSATRYRKSFMARVAFVMVAALVLAQWGAQTHAYAHDQNSRSQTDRQSHRNSQSHLDSCPQCPSFAPVLSVAGGPALLSAVLWTPIHLDDSSLPAALRDVPIALAFRSRAPPTAN